MLVNNTVDGTRNGAKEERNMAGSTTRERASSWPESHHYRPFDKADKTHKECLSLVSLSSKGRAFPPSLLPASVGILMFLSPSPSRPFPASLSFSSLSLSLLLSCVSSAHQRAAFVLSFPLSFSLSTTRARASFDWCGRGYACVSFSCVLSAFLFVASRDQPMP